MNVVVIYQKKEKKRTVKEASSLRIRGSESTKRKNKCKVSKSHRILMKSKESTKTRNNWENSTITSSV